MADRACEGAVRRLDEAVAEEDRMGERYHLAIGTATERSAYALLRAACEEVAHRYVQLKSIDDAGARNALESAAARLAAQPHVGQG